MPDPRRRLAIARLLLAPGTSLAALRLWRGGRSGLTFDAAWRRARLEACPDELEYQRLGHQAPQSAGQPATLQARAVQR